MTFFLRFEFVNFRSGHDVGPLVEFEPISQLHVLFHPSPAGIQNENRQPEGVAMQQVALNQPFPLTRYFLGNPCETIPWQVNEAVTLNLIEID